MKYQSELIKEIVESRGHETSSIHYESECVESWIKENVGAYPKLCDYQSEWLNYINENPIGHFPYETVTNVTEATVNNVVPYAYKCAILKGNSEVVAGKNKCNMEEIQTGWIDGSSGEVVSNAGVYIPVKVSGTITISNFIHNKSRYVYEYDASGNYLGRNSVTTNTVTLSLNENTTLIKIGFYGGTLSTVKSLELQVEQGEVATEYEPYNSTLVSVKMPGLTTTGKNLFDGELENGAIISSTGVNTPSADNIRSVGYIKVNPNASIVLSNDLNYTNNIIYEYDSNKDYIGRKTTNPFTTSTNCHYIRFRTDANQTNLDVKYQIEYGTIATPYEPFNSNILTVNEDVTLRGIGDVKDELNLLTGEISNNFNKITIDGTENWYKTSNETELTVRYRCDNIGVSILNINICICDSYNVGVNTLGDNLAVDFSGTMLTYRVLKSKFPTLEDFKKWLNDNPHTFIYQTEKSIKTVDLSIQDQDGNALRKIKPIEGTMHIHSVGTPLNPTITMEIPVEATTQNLASFIKEE